MKKFFAMLLCVIVAASSMSVSAKNWRVFTDVNLGYGGDEAYKGVEKQFTSMMLLSGGYQYKKLFLGLGTGIATTFGDVSEVPIYAQVRLDFFKKDPKSFSPYISSRLGYSAAAGYCGDGVFAEISGGFRKGLTENLGLNLGLSLATYGTLIDDYYSDEVDVGNSGVFFNVGLDF